MTPAIEHLKYWCEGEPSECGKQVAQLLCEWAGGGHHLDCRDMEKVDWKNTRFIRVKMDSAMTGGGLATYDFDNLTRLVFLAHDHCIRVDIVPMRMQKTFCFEVIFHPRKREGGMSQRHPTLESAMASWRNAHPIAHAVAIPEGAS